MLLAVNVHCKILAVKELLDQCTILSLQPRCLSCMNFSLVENTLFIASANSTQSVGFCAKLEMALEASVMSWLNSQQNPGITGYQRILMLLASRVVPGTQTLQGFARTLFSDTQVTRLDM